ncbi:MAG: DUF924 domain-containing protein [Polyangiaceae bacterium]|nr:DUF924 domain-containing protein [Polyangiaceae bacterium]
MGTADDVWEFWFGAPATDEAALKKKLKRWYMGGTDEDALIRARFGAEVERALAGELDDWAATPRGLVALVILLDQMPRSVFRDGPRAFAGSARAERLVVAALDAGVEAELSFEERQFLLMPLLHAEDVGLLERFGREVVRHVAAAPAWAQRMLGAGTEQADKYLEVVRRFGRFPHRNAALGRTSTPEEVEFLVGWKDRARPKAVAELEG